MAALGGAEHLVPSSLGNTHPAFMVELVIVVIVIAAGLVLVPIVRGPLRAMSSKGGLQSVAGVALVASVALILVVTLFPTDGGTQVKLLPLSDIAETVSPPFRGLRLLSSMANVLLFVPLGAALGMRGTTLGKTVLVGLALSTAVELVQLLFIVGRTTAADDLLLNALGAVLGHALSRWLSTAKYLPR